MSAMLLLASFGLLKCGQQSPSYDLLWRPHPNDELSYKMEIDIDSAPEKLTFTANIKNRVVKVRSNGDYDVESVVSDGRVKHGAHDDPLPDDPKPTTDTYNRRGEKIATTETTGSADESNAAISALDSITEQLTPPTPVHEGEKWTVLVKPNPKFKREAGKVVYTCVGAQDQGPYHTLKISFCIVRPKGTRQ